MTLRMLAPYRLEAASQTLAEREDPSRDTRASIQLESARSQPGETIHADHRTPVVCNRACGRSCARRVPCCRDETAIGARCHTRRSGARAAGVSLGLCLLPRY